MTVAVIHFDYYKLLFLYQITDKDVYGSTFSIDIYLLFLCLAIPNQI